MKKLANFTIVFVSVFLFSACASILNGKYQEVTLKTDSKENKVFVDDSLVGTGKKVVTEFKRDFEAKEVRIEREGYESNGYAYIQTRKSPLYILSIIPFGVTLYVPFMDSHPKAFNYPKDKKLPEMTAGREYLSQSEGNKHIYVNKATIEIPTGGFSSRTISYRTYTDDDFSTEQLKNANFSNDEEMNGENILFPEILNEVLEERGFTDTTEGILKRKTNTLFVDVKMTEWKIYNVSRSFVNAGATSFIFAEMTFDWTLRDVYKQELYNKVTTVTTDEFKGYSLAMFTRRSDDKDEKSALDKIIENGLEKSLIHFINSSKVQELLPIEQEEEIKEPLLVESGQAVKPTKLSEAVSACATVKLEDSHGSAFYINDNLLLTNYHVVAGNDTVEIITNDGTETEGVIIRKSMIYDLAVIKTKDYTSKTCLPLDNIEQAELGDAVFAIGTPSSIELTQTLSKGIISGHRKTDEVNLLQTDVSINPGNSGGPIVNTQGQLIAVVNSKLVGNGIEGIGFGIPAKEIMNYLKIELK